MINGDEKPERGPQILVVDDNPGSLKLLTGILSDKGYQVRPASSGRLALRSAEAEPPDLIILDIIMPEMNGYEVCRRIKKNDSISEIPVIFISSLEDPVDKVKGFEAGGVDFITKPYQREEVLARVQTHLSLRNLQIQLREQNKVLHDEIVIREKTEEELLLYQTNLESLIKERTDELDMFFSLNLDFLLIADRQGHIIRLNLKWEEILGYPIDDLIGKLYVCFIHPDDRKAATRQNQDATNDLVMNYVNRYRHKDGSYRWLEWYSCPTEGRLYAAARDISERVRFEEERKKLILQIQENIAELAILNDGIRNPLSIILSHAEALDSAESMRIIKEVDRIDDMVTNLDRQWINSISVLSFLERNYRIRFKDDEPDTPQDV